MAEVQLGNDIPSNSHKSAAQAQQNENKRPDVPVFEGQTQSVKRKNSGFWRWMKKMFLSDRTPKEIMKEIIEYKIVPGIKDNFRNSAMATLDSFIYSGSSPSVTSSQNNVSYNRMYNGQQTRPAQTAQSTDSKTDEINKGFSNPCFKTQMDAEKFLNMMKEYDYPTLSVHTLYMMRKMHIDYTWDAYGWTREEICAMGTKDIKRISNSEWPYMIALPEAHVIA